MSFPRHVTTQTVVDKPKTIVTTVPVTKTETKYSTYTTKVGKPSTSLCTETSKFTTSSKTTSSVCKTTTGYSSGPGGYE